MEIPMILLMFWTLALTPIVFIQRIKSLKTGKSALREYALMQFQQANDNVVKSTRCFNNLFEAPTLFYALSLLILYLGIESKSGVFLAWLYLITRVGQSVVHLTSNHLLLRMGLFLFSQVILVGMCILVFIQL